MELVTMFPIEALGYYPQQLFQVEVMYEEYTLFPIFKTLLYL